MVHDAYGFWLNGSGKLKIGIDDPLVLPELVVGDVVEGVLHVFAHITPTASCSLTIFFVGVPEHKTVLGVLSDTL